MVGTIRSASRVFWSRSLPGTRSTRVERFAGSAWRVVEAQHVVSTRKLVDSDQEQLLLEELLERSKPPLAPDLEGLHYLLATPFRYPPLRHGSRFASRSERSLWYGSPELHTAFAEFAYYRLVFLAGTAAELAPLLLDVSAFRASLASERAVDLRAPPFARYRSRISSPTSYQTSQRLGREMRAAGVEMVLWASARDPDGGANVGLFSPGAFARKRPSQPESWHCVANRAGVELVKRDFFRRTSLRFAREVFVVGGELPAPAA